MSAITSPDRLALAVPPCGSNGTAWPEGACMARVEQLFQALSSTVVLFVLVAMIAAVISVSLTTFHFHKSKMKKRKMQRAQEEYERDNCSPRAAAKGKPVLRQCVVERPCAGGLKRTTGESPVVSPSTGASASASASEEAEVPVPKEEEAASESTRHAAQTRDDHLLQAVAVS
ncbi:uncharacterized protein C11orf87 homolog [Salminus brasiliensis]|uniref:uncharacterized protein C11orf87 homolog n=1 Tax=Salminus brasiliensis TaxID=930266 RepID=UPI003B830912